MKTNTNTTRIERKSDRDTYRLEKRYISRCVFTVSSYVKIMSDEDRKKSREDVTEEIVRILKTAGRL